MITFNLFFLPFFMTGGRAVRADRDPRDPGLPARERAPLFGVAAAFCVYLFFLLLIITLITNRLAKATKSYAD